MVFKKIIKVLFTWWNGITVGTKLYTYFNGKKVGEDYFGNFYYESKDKKNRWCIYSNGLTLQKLVLNGTVGLDLFQLQVQKITVRLISGRKQFNGNLTGLDSAYKPRIVRTSGSEEDLDSYQSDYKAWKPE